MDKAHIGSVSASLFCVFLSTLSVLFVHPAEAFEGDYIWDERFKSALVKAKSGQANDQYAVGDMYFRGRGTKTNHLKALQWFLLAAEQGHRKAAYKTGYLYLHGEGLTPAPKQALIWFRRSASAGYVPSQYELGKLLLTDLAGPRDNAQALKWLGKAKGAKYELAEKEFTQTVNRMLRPGTVISDVTIPTIGLAALDKQRKQPTVADTPNFKHIILRSKWDNHNGPSIFLPSALTNCRENSAGIECISAKLGGQLASNQTSSQTSAKITDFNPDGKFRLIYADSISPANAQAKAAMAAVQGGTQYAEHVLDCALVAGRVIGCSQGTQKQLRFFASE